MIRAAFVTLFTMQIGLALVAIVPATAQQAPAPPTCGGTDLVEQARRDDPATYRRILDAAASIPNGEGLLWKFEKPGAAPSYLFGIADTTDETAVAIARSMSKYVEATPTLATRAEDGSNSPEKAAILANVLRRVRKDPTQTATLIGQGADLERLSELLRTYRIDVENALRLPPWYLWAVILQPPCERERLKSGVPTAGQVLIDLANRAGAKVVAVYPYDDDFDAFQSLDAKLVARVLVLLARRPGFVEDVFRTLLALYQQRLPGSIISMERAIVDLTLGDEQASRIINAVIVENRSLITWRHAKPLAEAGPIFLAADVFSLPGPLGLVELIRHDGYVVTRVQ